MVEEISSMPGSRFLYPRSSELCIAAPGRIRLKADVCPWHAGGSRLDGKAVPRKRRAVRAAQAPRELVAQADPERPVAGRLLKRQEPLKAAGINVASVVEHGGKLVPFHRMPRLFQACPLCGERGRADIDFCPATVQDLGH